MFRHSLRGLVEALRHPRLTLLLWTWNAAVSLVITWPVWNWWSGAVRYSPATDPMLERFRMGVFEELLQYDRTPVLGIVAAGILAGGVFTLIANAGLAVGTISTLLPRDAGDTRGFLQRFLDGVARHFSRSFALLLLTIVALAVALVLVVGVVSLIVGGLDDGGWEPAWLVQITVQAIAVGATVMLFLIALDYARIRMARDDARGIIGLWGRSLWLVLRHPLRTFGIWILFGLVLLLLLVTYATVRDGLPVSTWGTILLTIVVQQAFVLARTGLRVATLAGEIDAYASMRPAVRAVEEDVVPLDGLQMNEAPPSDVTFAAGDTTIRPSEVVVIEPEPPPPDALGQAQGQHPTVLREGAPTRPSAGGSTEPE